MPTVVRVCLVHLVIVQAVGLAVIAVQATAALVRIGNMEAFLYGFIFGFFAYPFWQIAKKIWSEAKKAREEW